MNKPNKLTPSSIIIVSGVISCIIVIISASFMFPIPGGDAEAYIPAAVSYSNGLGLKNIIYPLSYDTDIMNQGRFCLYPPLFPWVVGALMLDSTTKSAFLTLGLFSSISIFLFTFILTFIVKSINVSKRYHAAAIASIMIFSYTGMISPMSGRPELLASIFLLLGVIIFTCVRSLYISSILLGVLLGLLGATHPAGAIIAAVVFLLGTAYTFSSPKVIQLVLTSFAIALVTTFTIITLSPNGLTDTLAGISLHSKIQLGRTDSGFLLVLKYWILDPKGLFFGPLILFSFLLFITNSISIYRGNNTTIYYYVCSLLLLYFFYFFGFRTAPTNYNFILFQPVAYCILLYELYKSNPNKNTLINSSSRLSKNITILMLSLSLLSPFRTSFLFFDYLNSGKTYDQARHTVSSSLSGNEHLFFTGSMWSLSENYEMMWPWNQDMPDRFLNAHTTENVLVQQEARTPHFIPRNGSLIEDWRYLRKPSFFGFPVGNRPQGYGFSLWNIYK